MTTHSLPEAIERVRRFTMGSGTWNVEDVLAVCDAASRAEAAEREQIRIAMEQPAVQANMVLAEKLAAAERELEALREDKARLDWLASHEVGVNFAINEDNGAQSWWVDEVWAFREVRDTVRAAIDAGRRGEA